jgi:hypothetical protein
MFVLKWIAQVAIMSGRSFAMNVSFCSQFGGTPNHLVLRRREAASKAASGDANAARRSVLRDAPLALLRMR